MMPQELDVPHWARHRVNMVRRKCDMPERVTDRMIYARLIAYDDADTAEAEAALLSLIEETKVE